MGYTIKHMGYFHIITHHHQTHRCDDVFPGAAWAPLPGAAPSAAGSARWQRPSARPAMGWWLLLYDIHTYRYIYIYLLVHLFVYFIYLFIYLFFHHVMCMHMYIYIYLYKCIHWNTEMYLIEIISDGSDPLTGMHPEVWMSCPQENTSIDEKSVDDDQRSFENGGHARCSAWL